MSSWSHGYNVALGYTYGFYRETTPSWLGLAALMAGAAAPSTRQFRYLELGCGQGFGLTLLASLYPQAQFVGVDFNPLHIAHARGLAAAAGLANIRFEEADFMELAQAWPADYGRFDYAVLHGILSWVSADLRKALTACLRHAVLPGGLVYASYNTQPGWVPSLPLQHLLNRHQQANGLAPIAAINHGLGFLKQLQEAGAALFATLPQLTARLAACTSQDRAYLVQEYLHENWKCFWFSEVVAALKPAKLEYLATATLAELFLGTMLPDAQRQLLADQQDTVFYQELLDACVNQSFRRDIFQRGGHRLWPVQQRDALLEVRVGLLRKPTDAGYTFKTVIGEVSGKPELYAPLLDALADGPQRLATLKQLPMFADKPLFSLTQTVCMLLHGDMIGLVPDDTNAATSLSFNRTVARAAAEGAPYHFIASTMTGNGIAAQPNDLLLLDAMACGCPCQSDVLGNALIQRLQALGRTLQKAGTPLTEPAAVAAEAEQLAANFLAVTLPEWKRLGAWG